MKRFKKLTEELFTEGGERYPADDMTISELKIACYAAQNILDRLESGAMVQRWQISAIVKAKEELASVYTSMSSDDDDEWEDEYDDMEEEEPMYVGFEYPSMYGEQTELDESSAFFHSEMDKLSKKAHADAVEKSKKTGPITSKTLADINAKLGNTKKTNEETDYEVDVEGLPKMYVKADSPSQVKNNLRKVVKNPDMIRGVERVAKATLQKIFRDKASGKEEVAEEVKLDEAETNYVIKHKKTKQVLNTHSDYATAKDEHEGLGADKHEYGVYKQTKKDAALRNRNTYREEVELDEASYRDSGYANMLKASRKADKEADKIRAQQAKASKPKEVKEEADLRITKIYNKFPKKATYAVHSPDRKYYKEFDTMDAAEAHRAEKTGK